MTLAPARSGVLALLIVLLQACGGGDGDGDDGGGGGGPNPRLNVNLTEIDVAAVPGDEAPRSQIIVTISNPRPDEDLYVGAQYSTAGISNLDFFGTSASSGHLEIFFHSPSSIENGTYEDVIQLHVCTDEACTQDIAGSPVTIRTSYVVSSGIGARIDRDSIVMRTDTQDSVYRRENVRLTIDRAPFGGAHIETDDTGNGVIGVTVNSISGTEHDIEIEFVSGLSLRPGIYDDTVTITVCYENSCARQFDGSPFTVTTRMTVDTGAEPGIEVLEVSSRATLPHDIVDAEYSAALDSVVMAGRYPVDALYVYDVDAGTERQVLLSRPPTAVGVSPDGLTAAVGHDGLISIVDLVQAGQPGAPAPTLLDVSTDVLDVALNGDGKVHALARFAEWQDIRTIDIATNTEQLSSGMQIYGGALGRLHPSGNSLYTAENNISSLKLQKWDVTAAAAAWVADMPFQPDVNVCGNLWFRSSGAEIYTACGNVFRVSGNVATDMTHLGKLGLFAPRDYDWLISSLSHSSSGEIALIEVETDGCVRIVPEAARCYTHLASYDDDTFARQSVYTVGPVTVGERSYPQRGLFVFHDSAGNRKIVLSKLDGMTDPDTEFYLSVVP